MSITIEITTSAAIGQKQSRTVKFSDASFSTDESKFVSALAKNINDFVSNYRTDE